MAISALILIFKQMHCEEVAPWGVGGGHVLPSFLQDQICYSFKCDTKRLEEMGELYNSLPCQILAACTALCHPSLADLTMCGPIGHGLSKPPSLQ